MIQSKVLENLEINNLNHLGIIAGIIDEIGIVEIINKELGKNSSDIALDISMFSRDSFSSLSRK